MSCVCDTELEYQRVVDLLTNRFMPGETSKTAIIQLQSEIHRSTQQQNLGVVVSDFFHYHAKEKTLEQVVTSSQNIGQSLVGNTLHLGSKVGSYFCQMLGSSSSNKKIVKEKTVEEEKVVEENDNDDSDL